MSSESRDAQTYLLMVVAMVFWGGSFVASKIALPEIPPMTLTFYRFLIATAIIFPYMWVKDEKRIPMKQDIPLLFGLGLLGISGFFACMFTSLLYTSAANSSTINALNPLASTVFAAYITDEKLTKRKMALILFAFSGILLTVTGGDINVLLGMRFNKGDVIMFVAMISFAVYGIYSKKATTKYSPLLVTAYAFLFGWLQTIPLMLREGVWMNIINISGRTWAALLFMSVGSSVVGYLIQQVSIKRIGVNKSSLFINLVPIFATIFAHFVLGDPITIVNIVAIGIIASAVYLNTVEK
ncbi:MAG: DMT family transporter [Candidatus Bathyarchaeota archaeon]|nr:DMT family transporter [Candidatus Bathyarchaeota archaeon]